MSSLALALVLASAVLHATWNLAVKASGDRLVTAAGQVVFGAIAFSPVLLVTGLPRGVWGWIALSSVVHLLYGLSLVAAYDRGDLSTVYPIARGTTPALVSLGAAVLLGERLDPIGIAAVALIVGGITVIGISGRPRGVGWALVTGLFITTYTLIDGTAVRHLNGPIAYTASIFLGNAVLYAPFVWWRRRGRELAAAARRDWWRYAAGGMASAGAYALVLVAARIAPLGLVSAVRETSVLLGALAGWLILDEGFPRRRIVAAISIVAGLAAASL